MVPLTSTPAVSTAFKIFLILYVTAASTERSFSKLKLIKSFVRSTIAQDRLERFCRIIELNKIGHIARFLLDHCYVLPMYTEQVNNFVRFNIVRQNLSIREILPHY